MDARNYEFKSVRKLAAYVQNKDKRDKELLDKAYENTTQRIKRDFVRTGGLKKL